MKKTVKKIFFTFTLLLIIGVALVSFRTFFFPSISLPASWQPFVPKFTYNVANFFKSFTPDIKPVTSRLLVHKNSTSSVELPSSSNWVLNHLSSFTPGNDIFDYDLAWKFDFRAKNIPQIMNIDGSKGIILSGLSNKLIALNPKKEEVLWKKDNVKKIRTTGVYKNNVIAPGSSKIYNYDLKTGEIIWGVNNKTEENIISISFYKDKIILSGWTNKHGIVKVLNLKTGKTLWSFKNDNKITTHPYVSIWVNKKNDKNLILIGDEEGFIHALDLENGKIIYELNVNSRIESSPTPLYEVFKDRDICVSANWEGEIFGFYCDNGEKIWKVRYNNRNSDECLASPATSWNHKQDESAIYIGCEDGFFYKLNALTGEKIWEFDAQKIEPNGIYENIRQTPVLSDNVIYFGASGPGFGSNPHGTFFALDRWTGKLLWKHSDTNGSFYFGGPFIQNGILSVLNLDGVLYNFTSK